MPVEVDFLANTAPLLRGTKDVEAGLEKVASSLDDLAREGKQAGDKLGDGISDGAKDAETSTERLEHSFKDLAKAAKATSSDSGKDISSNIKRGTDDAGESVKEFQGEAASTAKETAASFDGSAESIVGAFQEVAANAFAGFGPAGMVAGLAAAAGIGLIVAQLDAAGASTEEVRERTAVLAQEYIETGGIGEDAIQGIADRIKDLATEQDASQVSLAKLADVSERAGSSYKDLAQAYAGNVDGLKGMWREGDKRLRQLQAEADAIDTTTSAGAAEYAGLIKKADAQQSYLGYLGQSLGVAKEAAEAERLYTEAGGKQLEARVAAIAISEQAHADAVEAAAAVEEEAAAKRAAAIAAVDAAYDAAAASTADYIDAESGMLDVAGYLEAMQAKEQAIRDYQETLATSPLTDAAKSFLDSQGLDAAATFLQGYKNATPEQQAELNRIWSEAGSTSSGSYSAALTAGIPGSVAGPTITLTPPDVESVLAGISYRARNFTLRVPSIVVDRNGNPVL